MIVKGNFEVMVLATNIGWVDLGGGEQKVYKESRIFALALRTGRDMLLFGEKASSIDVDGSIKL